MDKYFDPAYDPLLDTGPISTSLNDIVPEGAFDEWDKVLQAMEQQRVYKAEKKYRESDHDRSSSKKKRKRDKEKDREERAAEERERQIKLGLIKPSPMDVKYAKRGAMREWDVGKKVT